MKLPTVWADIHRSKASRLVRLQAVVRGWLVRLRVRLGGPGVLRRAQCFNDEELVTCTPKESQRPFDYFAFDEGGKVWWFDFQTLWRWACQSHEPVNPYTKVPLSLETRKRLRAGWAYRQRHRQLLPEESSEVTQRIRSRWNAVCQVFTEHGFVDVHPDQFIELGQSELSTMFLLLERDLQVVFSASDPGVARALRLCRRGFQAPSPIHPEVYTLWSVYTILLLLTIHRDSYPMTFSMLSALYRC
jgi:hypothetical protein